MSEQAEIKPLFGFRPSKIPLQKEDAIDRTILFLVAQGFNDREIALELGVSWLKVNHTRRQPWFMQALVELLHRAGAPAVERRLQQLGMEMIERGADLARNAMSESVKATTILGLLKLGQGDKLVLEDR